MKPRKDDTIANAMIIEDEKDLSYLLAVILRKQNLSASCVGSIAEAKKHIKKNKPNILFLDNHLPDGLGTDFIGQIKKTSPATKIIMMTAQDSIDDVKKAFSNGADYFISKPFNTDAIKSILCTFKLAS